MASVTRPSAKIIPFPQQPAREQPARDHSSRVLTPSDGPSAAGGVACEIIRHDCGAARPGSTAHAKVGEFADLAFGAAWYHEAAMAEPPRHPVRR